MFDDNTVYITGLSRSQLDNPITYQYGRLVIGLVIEKNTNRIVDCSSTTVLAVTDQFLRSIFCGKRIIEDDGAIEEALLNRYVGASQKSILAAYRDARRRFVSYQQGDAKAAHDFRFGK